MTASILAPGGLSEAPATGLQAPGSDAADSRGRVSAALRTLRTGLAVFGSPGVLLFANHRFGELLGMADPLPTGIGFTDLLDLVATRAAYAEPEDAAFIMLQRQMDRSFPSETRQTYAGRVVEIASDPLPDGGWTMTIADLGPPAEDEAARRAALLHSILDAFPHGVCVYGADHRVTMFNRAYTQVMAGAPLSVGDHLEEIIQRRAAAGEYGPGVTDEIMSQQLAFDVTRPQMRKRRRPNGVTFEARTTPLPDGGYISVVTDITPLTEAETAISRRAEELAFMLSNIRHGVMLWGPDRRLIASNAVASELLELPLGLLTPGRTQDELVETMFQRGIFGQGEETGARLRIFERSTGRCRWCRMRSRAPAGSWISGPTQRAMAAGSPRSPT